MCECVAVDEVEDPTTLPSPYPDWDFQTLIDRINAFFFSIVVWFTDFENFKWDHRTYLERVSDRMEAIYKDLEFVFTNTFKPLVQREFTWKKESQGLFVLIHGLNAHPNHFDDYIDLIGEDYDIYIPFVPQKGLCTLEEASEAIYEQVKSYALQFPDRRICLIGHSNGGRVVNYIDLRMRFEVPYCVLLAATIAALHFGSRLSTVASHFIDNIAYGELAFGSDKSKELLNALREPLPEGVVREYLRYASLDDFFISVDTAFATFYKQEKNFLTWGEGHGSIINCIAPHLINECKQFLTAELPVASS